MKILNKLDTLDNIQDGEINKVHRVYRSVTGTTAVTSSPYSAAKWQVTDSNVTAYTDGMIIDIKVPVAGNSSYGTVLQINELGYKPVVYNVNSMIGTRYSVNSHIFAVYNATQTATWYNNSASATTETGCWQIYDYDSTNIYQLKHNNGNYLANNIISRYCLLLQTNETTLMPTHTNSSYSTGTTKPINTAEFNPFGEIFYYNSTTTVASGGSITGNTLYTHVALDLRYSFNIGTTLTTNKDVYIIATPTENSKATLTSPYITQTLPTEEDGKIYIYLGHGYSTYQVELEQNHPIYYNKGGKILLYTGKMENDGASIELKTWKSSDFLD